MLIIKKSEAMKLLKSNPDLIKGCFCKGKYKWEKESDHVGNPVPDIKGVVAVYAERRSDRDGAYASLRSISVGR